MSELSDLVLLVKALDELVLAAEQRENTMGDPSRLIECKANLREASEKAKAALLRVKENR